MTFSKDELRKGFIRSRIATWLPQQEKNKIEKKHLSFTFFSLSPSLFPCISPVSKKIQTSKNSYLFQKSSCSGCQSPLHPLYIQYTIPSNLHILFRVPCENVLSLRVDFLFATVLAFKNFIDFTVIPSWITLTLRSRWK